MNPRTTSPPEPPQRSESRSVAPEGQDERLAYIERLTRDLIEALGEDPTREGLVRTPDRVARAWRDLTAGYGQRVEDVVNGALFAAEGSEMVVVRDIDLASHCEHHMVSFVGRAHVAYLPDRRVVGLSKLARVVDIYARRLQIQEKLTVQVADGAPVAWSDLEAGELAVAQRRQIRGPADDLPCRGHVRRR